MSINALVEELKQNNEDFEFYPTTKEMIKTIYDAAKGGEWLDIGCGTCNFKKFFEELAKDAAIEYTKKEELYRQSNWNDVYRPKEHERAKYISQYYVIEKSKTLIDRLDKDVIVLGTDFHNTLLIDKPVENIFCNPPYSEFEEWAAKIIFESNCNNIYLVIPQRWNSSEEIQKAIKESNSSARILGSFDFLHAERQARAKVDIVKITRNEKQYYRSDSENQYNETAFDKWFDDTFKMSNKKDLSEWEKEEVAREEIKNKLVIGGTSKAQILVNLYDEEMQKFYEHFKAIAALDVEVLETIGIRKEAVKAALKKKASGAKIRYWKILMDELEEITERLTSETRKSMFDKFAKLQTVDFTIENIYPLIIWVLKNASSYYNDQLISFFKKLSSPDNVKPYKSNQKVFLRDEWRHSRFKDPEKVSHYTLDYRIIMSSVFDMDYHGRLEKGYQTDRKLQDIFTIARNLGFEVGLCDIPSSFGEKCTCLYKNGNKVFMEYRAYKNGNMHVKFDIEFIKAMNVEVSRLLGWIRHKEDIKTEFPAEMAKGAEKYFKTNYTCLNVSSVPLLTVKKEPEFEFLSNVDELVILLDSHYSKCLSRILEKINKFNGIIETESGTLEKCLNILETQQGFIYKNCLITKQDNKTKVEFREMQDFKNFEKSMQEAA